MNEKVRLYFAFLTFSIVLSLSIILIEELFFEHSAQKVALQNALQKTKEREGVLKSFLHDSQQNLISIRESLFFNSYLEKGNEVESLNDIFLTYAKSNSDFFQLRFIDKDGFEKIRVDRTKYGQDPYLVSQDSLQNKNNRYYFNESKTKPLNEVWFSALDLNIENGEIETPYIPTIRAVLPVGIDGEFYGVLVVNYFMENFLKKLTYAPLYDMILYDDNGCIIHHYADTEGENARSWGNSLKHKHNIKNEFPNDYNSILQTPVLSTTEFVSRKLNVEVYGGLNLLLQLKASYVKQQSKQSLVQYSTVALMVFIISIFLTYFMMKFFSRKILNIDKLEKLNNALHQASKVAKIGFWEYNASEEEIVWSEGVYEIFNLPNDNKVISYEAFLLLLPFEERRRLDQEFKESIKAKVEYFCTHAIDVNGSEVKYVEERGRHVFDKNGDYIKTIGSIYDITSQRKHELQILASRNELQTIFDTALDGIAIVNSENKFVKVNKKYIDLLGYSEEELLTFNCLDLTEDKSVERSKEVFNHVKQFGYYENFERYCIHKNGNKVRLRSSIALLDNEKDFLVSTADVTQLYEAHQKIKQQSYVDELTSLNNRKSYNKRIQELLAEFNRYNSVFSIIMLDIDNFKNVNDTFGHQTGDNVLKDLSSIINSIARTNDYAFRVGGEEFVILLTKTDLKGAQQFAEKLRKTVEYNLKIADQIITISIGVTSVEANDSEDTIYKRVDNLLYTSKRNGKNQVSSSEK